MGITVIQLAIKHGITVIHLRYNRNSVSSTHISGFIMPCSVSKYMRHVPRTNKTDALPISFYQTSSETKRPTMWSGITVIHTGITVILTHKYSMPVIPCILVYSTKCLSYNFPVTSLLPLACIIYSF